MTDREDYWAQPQPEIETVACVCGYTAPKDRPGLKLLRNHQSLCQKFKGATE